ncbi:prepilin-type N-terminal cleavage/methylation domain-containing protein [Photobacterium rosenbergii]|uniref:prepilin-type N-terminal cleavage/methylation domain-containing protein n=1 Tax=Photobacterium rosenbergii TaxID=294936 RepID=UPI001C990214|nr:prepilin-type N-terminal cleavage/methylation domain-containing protein [Photobacterium rosenbergii]MBY5949076.1 prepilin-type N-terminal cleavage/methylation domain-containing protein [Photobacterium rosenbergii]
MPRKNYGKSHTKSAGFTLLELIIVIVLIGIISVTAASRLFGRSGFDAVLARDQAISIARQIQLMGMNSPVNPANPNRCLALRISTTEFGSENCASNSQSTHKLTLENDLVNFSFFDGVNAHNSSDIYFDMLGRPSVVSNQQLQRICTASNCQVTITSRNGEQASLCINSEGYINDCSI